MKEKEEYSMIDNLRAAVAERAEKLEAEREQADEDRRLAAIENNYESISWEYNLYECQNCFAVVHKRGREWHNNWHRQIAHASAFNLYA